MIPEKTQLTAQAEVDIVRMYQEGATRNAVRKAFRIGEHRLRGILAAYGVQERKTNGFHNNRDAAYFQNKEETHQTKTPEELKKIKKDFNKNIALGSLYDNNAKSTLFDEMIKRRGREAARKIFNLFAELAAQAGFPLTILGGDDFNPETTKHTVYYIWQYRDGKHVRLHFVTDKEKFYSGKLFTAGQEAQLLAEAEACFDKAAEAIW